MDAVDKIKIVAEEIAGKTREVMGTLTGNEGMVAEGEAEVLDAELKKAHEDDE